MKGKKKVLKKGSGSRSAAAHPSRYSSALQGIILLVIFLILQQSYKLSEIDIPLLWSRGGIKAAKEFLAGMFPPDLSIEFLSLAVRATLDTLYISIAGTLLGVILAIPLSPLATSSLTRSGILKTPAKRALKFIPFLAVRGLLNLLRSVPELIWALIFVRAVGLGPLPGVLALGVTYAGALGKVYSEIFDSVKQEPLEALHSTGASKGGVILYGYLPQALPDLTAYTLYRWECGIRTAVVLGFVGAGGIGQELELSMRMFNYHEAVTLLIILIILVSLVDAFSSWVRRKIV